MPTVLATVDATGAINWTGELDADNAPVPSGAPSGAFVVAVDDPRLVAFRAAQNAPLSTISRAAFLGRFTADEMLAIATAAQSNAQVHVWIITAQAHDAIDLAADLTKQGLDALVSAGLLTAEREGVILTP